MKMKFFKHLAYLACLFTILPGCSSKENDEPNDDSKKEECTIRFRYDLNMLQVDAFSSSVSSVALWAFDKNGKLVWSHSESLDKATSENYEVKAKLPAGEYDFVTWCGLTSNLQLLPTLTPNSISQLSLNLPIAGNECKVKLPDIFNGSVTNFTVSEDNNRNSITLNLTQATKDVRVIIQSMKTHINANDFDITITDAPNSLEWNLTPISNSSFTYRPYNLEMGSTEINDSFVSVVIADFSTLRFVTNSQAILNISRKSDNQLMTRTLLVPHLLEGKSYEAGNMTDQEYLDRQNSYRLMLIYDK
ncbi:MAG: FimB/Mfa2 family fimbrial subunit [Muribaculaceae bacterium]|nr:FimB/Mfa2 family fimbrial subunit [Muribaculaceae bacterium]